MKNFKAVTFMLLMVAIVLLAGCATDASVVSQNLSLEADQFRIERRIVFVNGITDNYLLVVEGLCSIEDQGNQLEVVCKIGSDKFVKHFLGLSDNVTYFAEQLEETSSDPFHYKVLLKPETILPSFSLETSAND
jgi:hypothetical protein